MKKHALFIPTANGEEYFFVRWLTEQESRISATHTPFKDVSLYTADLIDGVFELRSHRSIRLRPTGIHPNLFYVKVGEPKKLLLT